MATDHLWKELIGPDATTFSAQSRALSRQMEDREVGVCQIAQHGCQDLLMKRGSQMGFLGSGITCADW